MKISSAADSVGGLEVAAVEGRVAGEVRVDFRDRLAGAARAGDRADLEVGVPGEQPQQLAARVAAGARHRDPYAHDSASSLPEEVCIPLHEYATREGGRGCPAGRYRHGATRHHIRDSMAPLMSCCYAIVSQFDLL
jgi:hypothetical protein